MSVGRYLPNRPCRCVTIDCLDICRMDANNPNKKVRNTPEYAEYQRDNFWKSNDGEVPPFNTGLYSHSIVEFDSDLACRARQT